jgi:hypothetical protein
MSLAASYIVNVRYLNELNWNMLYKHDVSETGWICFCLPVRGARHIFC